jgi:AcrR family transcriptional regulator
VFTEIKEKDQEDMASRKYRLKKRAVQQAETRQQIVEATVHLHETIGVPGTTITAIAKQAGVERLTVYRHFSDQQSLLTACTSHYFSQNPLPDPGQWESIADPELHLRAALGEIYAFYRRTEAMMSTTYRDIVNERTLQEVLAPFFEYWRDIRDQLAEKYPGTDERSPLVCAAIGHAIHFFTWHSLVRQQGLGNDQAVEVMAAMVQCVSAMK